MSLRPAQPSTAQSAASRPSRASALQNSRRRRTRRRDLVGYLYIAPAFLVVGLFFLCPLGLLIWMALNNWP
jgi:hypothetical protein